MNLIKNAMNAVLDSEVHRRPRIHIATESKPKQRIAVLSVRDNGVGIDEGSLTRIFEPYFSTKNDGTGLGLAISKRIVNDHQGFIRVYSEKNKGTEFRIELPTQTDLPPQLTHPKEKLKRDLNYEN